MTTLDKQAYEILFKKHYARLCRLAFSFVGDMEVSKDLVSDVFTNVWLHREELDTSKDLSGYLFISMRNRCASYLRSHPSLIQLNELMKISLQEEDASDLLAMEERIKEVNRLLDQMSPRTRFVLKECIYNDRTYREVAQDLGITTDGIKRHIVKGLGLLRLHFHAKKSKK